MTREEIAALVGGATKEQIDGILALYGQGIAAIKSTLAAKEQELATAKAETEGLQAQISVRDKDIDILKKTAGVSEELTTKISELQGKYDTDTKDLKDQLATQTRTFLTEKLFDKVEFASTLAREAAIAKFNEAKYQIKDGSYVGADQFIADLKSKDPAAFVAPKKGKENQGQGEGEGEGEGEDEGEGEGDKQPAFFTSSVTKGGNQGDKDKAPAFNFGGNFIKVRKPKED